MFLLVAWRGLGLSRLQLWNSRRIKSLHRKVNDPQTEHSERSASRAILSLCVEFNGKWILEESDLEVLSKSMNLIEFIASTWKPESSSPVLEARLGSLFIATNELNRRLGELMRLTGIRSVTRFRIRHVLLAIRVWEKKKSFEEVPTVKFLRRIRLDFIIQWLYAGLRFFDLSFWIVKMTSYLFQNVWLKILLVHFYLTLGELAGNVYRKEKDREETDFEPLLENVEEVPEIENIDNQEIPGGLKARILESRNKILLHTGMTEWTKTREVYMDLTRSIAAYYYPKSREPLCEARLYSILSSAMRLTESMTKMESVPVVRKLLEVKIVHLMKVKGTTDWFTESEVADWIKRQGLYKAAPYASVLFKFIKRRHPAVLFKEFAWTFTKEGLKRWALLYIHRKIAREARLVFSNESEN